MLSPRGHLFPGPIFWPRPHEVPASLPLMSLEGLINCQSVWSRNKIMPLMLVGHEQFAGGTTKCSGTAVTAAWYWAMLPLCLLLTVEYSIIFYLRIMYFCKDCLIYRFIYTLYRRPAAPKVKVNATDRLTSALWFLASVPCSIFVLGFDLGFTHFGLTLVISGLLE